MRLESGKRLTKVMEGLAAKRPRAGRGLDLKAGPRGPMLVAMAPFRVQKQAPDDATPDQEEQYDSANARRPLERGTGSGWVGAPRRRWGRGLYVLSKRSMRGLRDAALNAKVTTASGIQASAGVVVGLAGRPGMTASASRQGPASTGDERRRDGMAGALRGHGAGGARAGSLVNSRQHVDGVTYGAVDPAGVTLQVALLGEGDDPPVDFDAPAVGSSVIVSSTDPTWDFYGDMAVRPGFRSHWATLSSASGVPVNVTAMVEVYKNTELAEILTGTIIPQGRQDWQIIIGPIRVRDLTDLDSVTVLLTQLYWHAGA